MPQKPNREIPETSDASSRTPWNREGDDATSFGEWLRQQREIRGLSLREIVDSTKISMRYLEALETDRFDRLPAPIFARGFLRQYAQYVGLDSDDVVNFYLQASGEEEKPDEMQTVVQDTSGSRVFFVWIAALLLLLLVALLAYGAYRHFGERGDLVKRGAAADRDPAPPMAAPAPRAAPELPPAPKETSSEGVETLEVTLAFTGECWVEARVDGKRVLSELRIQGESIQLQADRRVELTLGEPGNVRVEVNDRPFDLEAPPGRVARGIVIDREAAGLPPRPAEESS